MTTAIDCRSSLPEAAIRRIRHQIRVDGPFFALADGVGLKVLATEYFRLVSGPAGAGPNLRRRETICLRHQGSVCGTTNLFTGISAGLR